MDKQRITLTAGLLAAAMGVKMTYNVLHAVFYFLSGTADLFGGDYSIYAGAAIGHIVYPIWYAVALGFLIIVVVAAAARAAKGGRAAYFWLSAVDGYIVITAVVSVTGAVATFAAGGLAAGPVTLVPMYVRFIEGVVELFALAAAVTPTYLLLAYLRKAIPEKPKETGAAVSE